MAFFKGALVALVVLAVATGLLLNAADGPVTDLSTAPPSAAQESTAAGSGEADVLLKDVRYSPATLTVTPGTRVTWTNRDPMGHTVTPVDPVQWGTRGSGDDPDRWLQEGDAWSFTFDKPGTYAYSCLPHASRSADGTWKGMVGTVVVTSDPAAGRTGDPDFRMPDASVVPSALAPPRVEPDADGIVRVTLTTREVTAKLADDVAYAFWTFDGTVPGPMVRVREGDTVEVTLRNDANSTTAHSVDFHAVTGPGGGAKATQTKPGESTGFRFKAIDPGVYVYHCATPHIPSHVANGMYGLIVVEPRAGLPPVDREFQVVESEWYTTGERGEKGLRSLSLDKLREEDPDLFTFNGRVGALTGEGMMHALVGEKIRIYFGVGGGVPSSFHLIGEVFDEVYMDGNEPLQRNRQTILVPAAGSAIVDLTLEVPGDYALVDHTLTRAIDGGAVGILRVEGPDNPEVFQGAGTSDGGR